MSDDVTGVMDMREELSWLRNASKENPELGPYQTSYSGAPMRPMTVVIVGGGTAGYFSALALSRNLPGVHVTLIEAPDLPPIGVGEATTPQIQAFLHMTLGIDRPTFYARVRPTWKEGIRFEWGRKAPYHFNAPFEWYANSVGVLGSLEVEGTINSMTIQAMMMELGAAPIVQQGPDQYMSLIDTFPLAYQFDIDRLLGFLRELIVASPDIRYIRDTVTAVGVSDDGSRVTRIQTSDGTQWSFDLYIDCTGFRSVLLESAMKSPFVSYASSLITDSALVFNKSNGEQPQPYTSAITMESGWTWVIPQRDEDHCGYVYSSMFCDPERAKEEVERTFPSPHGSWKTIRFRSGRHREAWSGNVIGIGNSYAFVEPLESTGVFMICAEIGTLLRALPVYAYDPSVVKVFNDDMNVRWDGLRWFLAAHYRFNNRLDTPFWDHVRTHADVSGITDLLESFGKQSPLRFREAYLSKGIVRQQVGLGGYDCILLGQGLPTRLVPSREPARAWMARRDRVRQLMTSALSQADALALVDRYPELLNGPCRTYDAKVFGVVM